MMRYISLIYPLIFLCTLSVAQILPELDCTRDNPAFGPVDLRSSSSGRLVDGSISLTQNNVVVSPNSALTVTTGANATFSIFRQGQNQLHGWLIRIAGTNPGSSALFLEDSFDVGIASFCSGLGLLNASDVSLAPPSTFAVDGFFLNFQGSSDYLVTMDVIASVSSDTSYEFFYDRFDLNIVVASERPSSSPTTAPSSSPSQAPTTRPPTPLPTPGPTPMPIFSPTPAPVGSTPSPTTRPPTPAPNSPTPSPTTRSPTPNSPTTSPTRAPTLSTDYSTSSPTAQPTSSSPTPIPVFTTTILNRQLVLTGVPEMDLVEQRLFEETTEIWLEDYYRSGTRTRRHLLESILDFTTTVSFQSQSVINPDSSSVRNTVTYNQEISYKQSPGSDTVVPLELVTDPFEDDTARLDYFQRLKDTNATVFENIIDATPDDSSAQLQNDGVGNGDSGSGSQIIIISALGTLAAALIVGLALLALYRRRKAQKHLPMDHKDELKTHSNYDDEERPATELIIAPDEVSALQEPSVGAFSYDAEQSMSTVDYDYAKVANGGNRSVISSAAGTLGENTRQDSLTQNTASDPLALTPWSKLGPKYTDKRNLFIVEAPEGKLGVVVDTPDEGPPVIFAVKDTSVLYGKVAVGDRLLAVDDEDVTSMSAVNISRLISRKADQPVRKFTLMRRK